MRVSRNFCDFASAQNLARCPRRHKHANKIAMQQLLPGAPGEDLFAKACAFEQAIPPGIVFVGAAPALVKLAADEAAKASAQIITTDKSEVSRWKRPGPRRPRPHQLRAIKHKRQGHRLRRNANRSPAPLGFDLSRFDAGATRYVDRSRPP
jgi:hypothetical protein